MLPTRRPEPHAVLYVPGSPGDAKCRTAAVRGWSFLLTSLDRPLGAAEAVAALGALAALTHDRWAAGACVVDCMEPRQRGNRINASTGRW